jgi:hypothetical protein
MTDEQLREVYGRAIAARHDARRAACPTPDALLAVARREGPESERVETLDHVMSCPDCRKDFELLRAIERGQRIEAREGANRIRLRRPIGVALVTGLAATLVFAAVIGPRNDWWRGGSDVVRDAGSGVVTLSPAADAVVPAGPLLFAWHAVPGARSYTLELLTPDGSTLATRQTTDTTVTLTDPRPAPGDYRWSVSARLDGGERRSVARRLRVTR